MTTAQTTWLETLILKAIKTQQTKECYPRVYAWMIEMECRSMIFDNIADSAKRNRVDHAMQREMTNILRGLQRKGLIKWHMHLNNAHFTA